MNKINVNGLGGLLPGMVGEVVTLPCENIAPSLRRRRQLPLTAIGKVAGTAGSQSGPQNRGAQARQHSMLLDFL